MARLINTPIMPQKQKAPRHWGSHPYFTKRAWNVIQEYIKAYTQEDDTVLDPFGGGGTTLTEALVLRRRGIHLDVSPFSNFIAQQIVISPVDTFELQQAFNQVKAYCMEDILNLSHMSSEEIEAMPIPGWYPTNQLPSNADVHTVDQLFTRRNLIALVMLRNAILTVNDQKIKNLLLFTFSSTLNKVNRTFSHPPGRIATRGDSGIMRQYRYWVPPNPDELEVWGQFEQRFRYVLKAKLDTNKQIGSFYSEQTARIIEGSATELTSYIEEESIDYVFTDPPYGAHIAYIDLATMWTAWLELPVSETLRQAEVIVGGELRKTTDEYFRGLTAAIEQIFHVLKWDSWFSIVFAHKEPLYWDYLMEATRLAGFEFVVAVSQQAHGPSWHKRENPFNVLSGEIIATFRKVKNPKTIGVSSIGGAVWDAIKNHTEVFLVNEGGSASIDAVNHTVIQFLIENGWLATVKQKYPNLTPLLKEHFLLDEEAGLWSIRADTHLGSCIPLDKRADFYVKDYMKRRAREGSSVVAFDDIILNVMPLLSNGIVPGEDTIEKALAKIAQRSDNGWELTKTGMAKDALQLSFWDVKSSKWGQIPDTHDGILYGLGLMGQITNTPIQIGRNEQGHTIEGKKLKTLSNNLPAAEVPRNDVIRQIDAIIWDQQTGNPTWAFEVEESTTILSAIERFAALLQVYPQVAGRCIIILPQARQATLDKILRESVYVGYPLYLENKMAYIWKDQFLTILQKHPTSVTQFEEELIRFLHHPKIM